MTVLKVSEKMVVRDCGDYKLYVFHCPACEEKHVFHVGEIPQTNGARWSFDGNKERPTFSPSLLMYAGGNPAERRVLCHLFVRSGMIEYCTDCPHEYAGKTIELPDFPNIGAWLTQ